MSLLRASKPGDVVAILDVVGRGRSVLFTCPGCGENHCLPVDELNRSSPRWLWNGSTSRPTLEPSILMRTTRLTERGREQYQTIIDGGGDGERWKDLDREEVVCHSFVRDGSIEFLGDCSHSLAGRTIPLSPVDQD